jgi:hypothetical protein
MMEQLGITRLRPGPSGQPGATNSANYDPIQANPFPGLLDGELAWRQHDGGHEDRSNLKYFIAWANRLIQHSPPAPANSP